MKAIYRLFAQAPILGSLIDPRRASGVGFSFEFNELQPLLEQAMQGEAEDVVAHEMAVTASGIAKAAAILASQFVLVVTNVPYLSNRKQSDELKTFCTSSFHEAKNDLGVSFLLRLGESLVPGGTLGLVMSQYWLFKSSYSKVRDNLLRDVSWPILAKLGPGAFETISGEVVNVLAGAWTASVPDGSTKIAGVDGMPYASPSEKADALKQAPLILLDQAEQRANPESRVLLGELDEAANLERFAIAPQGAKTGDDDRWRFCGWEIDPTIDGWIPYQTTVRSHVLYGGRHLYLDWRTKGAGMVRPRIKNLAVGKIGVAISQSGDLPATLYQGERFDSNIAPLIPDDPDLVPAMWAYCSSDDYVDNVRLIDQSMKVTNVPLIQVPFDVDYWRRVAAEKYPNGLPKPHSDDPTQWLFGGHPKGSEQPLQVAAARLLGYRWPRQSGISFPDCPAVGADGLESFADEDGIVCLTPLRGEAKAADRLRKLLDAAFAEGGWNERQLLANACSRKIKLDEWLRDEFFEQHCKLFHHRPFIWHIWDGRPDGFHALVNYHRLAAPDGGGFKLLESLTYSYLGDWIRRQQSDSDKGVPGAEDRLLAAEFLQQELKQILAGEPPYDLFIRWKPLHEQAIGWHPDINDGVRLNIRPFLLARDVKKKGAGILRWKPNIKWGRDRGREPERPRESFPWFWCAEEPELNPSGDTEYPTTDSRWNNVHFTTAAKQAAREARQKKGAEA